MFKRQVDYCSGAFLLFRRTDFLNLNGFDNSFSPAYYEETDFCIQLNKSGLKTVYDPNVVIVHYEFASSGNVSDALSLQEKNKKTLAAKHEEWLEKKYAPSKENILIARTANDHKNINILLILSTCLKGLVETNEAKNYVLKILDNHQKLLCQRYFLRL